MFFCAICHIHKSYSTNNNEYPMLSCFCYCCMPNPSVKVYSHWTFKAFLIQIKCASSVNTP